MAEIPADQLSDEEKKFILDRFFDTNRDILVACAIRSCLPAGRQLRPAAAYPAVTAPAGVVHLAWMTRLAGQTLLVLVARVAISRPIRASFSTSNQAHRRSCAAASHCGGRTARLHDPLCHPSCRCWSYSVGSGGSADLELPACLLFTGLPPPGALGVQFYEDHFGVPRGAVARRGLWRSRSSLVSRAGLRGWPRMKACWLRAWVWTASTRL